MGKRNLRFTFGAGATALLSACAGVGVQHDAPGTVAVAAQAHFRNASLTATEFAPHWWALFGDERLQALIEHALVANHDVRIATEHVLQARAGGAAAASRLLPTVAVTGSASAQNSGLPDAVKQGQPDTRVGRAALEVGWELDLFGAARASASAAELDAQAADMGVDATRLLISAEVARQYFAWQGARARGALLERLLQTQRATEELMRRREVAGQASRFDLARAAGDTQALAAQLPALRTLAAVSEHQLALLLGGSASHPVALLDSSAPARLPQVPELAAGQPAELLLRRPDLRVAEKQLAAAGARTAQARADLWPKFFLSVLLGREDLRLNALALSPARYSSVALAFALPVFNGGRLRAQVDLQSSRERAAALHYEHVVLRAVQDVESALTALAQERARGAALAAATEQRRLALRRADSLRREGQIDQLQWLDAQRGVIAAELTEVDSRTQLALDAVQLFMAMGGAWTVPTRPSPHTSEPTPTTLIAGQP